jgi:hypothetical protein
MKIKDLCIRVVGKVAHIWSHGGQKLSAVVVNRYEELDQVLDLIYNIGEAANIAPLKGIAGVIRLIIKKTKVRERIRIH